MRRRILIAASWSLLIGCQLVMLFFLYKQQCDICEMSALISIQHEQIKLGKLTIELQKQLLYGELPRLGGKENAI